MTGIVTETFPRLTLTLPLAGRFAAVNTPSLIVPTSPCTLQLKPLLLPSTLRWRYIAEAESSVDSPHISEIAVTGLSFWRTLMLSAFATTSICNCAELPPALA